MKSSGFTLLETIIYCALFSVLMSGTLTTFYALLSSTETTRENTAVLAEVNFIERKLSWAFSGATEVVFVSSTELQIVRPDLGSESPITLLNSTGHLYLVRGSSLPVILTDPTLPVTAMSFTYVAPKVTIRYSVAGTPFMYVTYLH